MAETIAVMDCCADPKRDPGVRQLERDVDRRSDRKLQRKINGHSSFPNVMTSPVCAPSVAEKRTHGNVNGQELVWAKRSEVRYI